MRVREEREQHLKIFLSFFIELHSSLVLVSHLLVNLQSPRDELESSPVVLLQLVQPVLNSKVLRLLVDDVHHDLLPHLLLLQQLRVIFQLGQLVLSDVGGQTGLHYKDENISLHSLDSKMLQLRAHLYRKIFCLLVLKSPSSQSESE